MKCNNNKWKIGEHGQCEYHTKEMAEKAYKGYLGHKHSGKQAGYEMTCPGCDEHLGKPGEFFYPNDTRSCPNCLLILKREGNEAVSTGEYKKLGSKTEKEANMKKSATDLEHIIWERKPGTHSEVEQTIESNDPVLEELPTLNESDIHPPGAHFGADFTGPVPEYFIMLGVDGQKYLIDPQGYNYPRYAVKIVPPQYQARTQAKVAVEGKQAQSSWDKRDESGQVWFERTYDEHTIGTISKNPDQTWGWLVTGPDGQRGSGEASSLEEAKNMADVWDSTNMKQASTKIAVDQSTKSYFEAYFAAYGASLVRDLAFKKSAKKAQSDGWKIGDTLVNEMGETAQVKSKVRLLGARFSPFRVTVFRVASLREPLLIFALRVGRRRPSLKLSIGFRSPVDGSVSIGMPSSRWPTHLLLANWRYPTRKAITSGKPPISKKPRSFLKSRSTRVT